MIIYNDFMGIDTNNTTTHFFGNDSNERFIENSKKMPEDWYYHNVPITYEYNNYGHRCKNFDKIDQDNYILFTGCSHTMGVGLELEKTYPYQLSKKLGMDYYNLAMPGSGIDALEYNLFTWYFKIVKKPKLLIIQYPDHSRFMEYNPLHERVMPKGSWSREPKCVSFIVNAEESGMFYARKELTVALIKNVTKNSTVITCNIQSQQQYGYDNLYFPILDRARDLSHAGILSHNKYSELLLNQIEVNKLI